MDGVFLAALALGWGISQGAKSIGELRKIRRLKQTVLMRELCRLGFDATTEWRRASSFNIGAIVLRPLYDKDAEQMICERCGREGTSLHELLPKPITPADGDSEKIMGGTWSFQALLCPDCGHVFDGCPTGSFRGRLAAGSDFFDTLRAFEAGTDPNLVTQIEGILRERAAIFRRSVQIAEHEMRVSAWDAEIDEDGVSWSNPNAEVFKVYRWRVEEFRRLQAVTETRLQQLVTPSSNGRGPARP